MSWTETHRRWRALHDIDEHARRTGCDELPWNREHAEIFGDPETLVAALRYRWALAVQAQLDGDNPSADVEARRRELARRYRGTLHILRRWDDEHDLDGSPRSTLAEAERVPA
jgi:hypothetical protein